MRSYESTSKCGLGVLVSGNGTNLQAILDACRSPEYPAEVKVVISNKPDVYALERARNHRISSHVIPHQNFASRETFESEIADVLEKAGVDLLILAGFMRILSPSFVRRYPNRILNIHPALLPAFPGTYGIEEAWDYGVKITGVTVHFVDEGTDTGPIVLQEAVSIEEKETLESLREKVHSVEHRLFPKAIRLYAEGRLKVDGRKVLLSKDS